jgi:uncharacterized protein (TIGR02145 family)
MKKLLTLTFILLATTQFAFAQQAIAKIKYEEAEEAYAVKDYKTTLKKLDEVETILKSTNPKVMYLRIMAQSSDIEYNPLNDLNILVNTRKLCAKYLKDYENVPNNEDKYRDIYKKSEALNTNYPATLDEFNKKVEEKKQEGITTICSQVWATKNLNVSTYSDGTPIPQVTDQNAWITLTTGAWCYLNNDPANGVVYGKLYNWYAIAGIYDAASLANPDLRKNLAPSGWHIPTDAEWTKLIDCLGGDSIAGGKMKETGTTHWESPNRAATNSNGFIGLPGGYRYTDGLFYGIGKNGAWWSSDYSTSDAWFRCLNAMSGIVNRVGRIKIDGFSVRCLSN